MKEDRGERSHPKQSPRCCHPCCYVIACQSSSIQALQALAYLSKVGNSSSVVGIRVLKLYAVHHPSYGNNLSTCKFKAWKTCPESEEDNTLSCIIRLCLEVVTVLVKTTFLREIFLYSVSRGYLLLSCLTTPLFLFLSVSKGLPVPFSVTVAFTSRFLM